MAFNSQIRESWKFIDMGCLLSYYLTFRCLLLTLFADPDNTWLDLHMLTYIQYLLYYTQLHSHLTRTVGQPEN